MQEKTISNMAKGVSYETLADAMVQITTILIRLGIAGLAESTANQSHRNSANTQRIPSGSTTKDDITPGKLEAGQRRFAHEKIYREKNISLQHPRHITAESIRPTATPAPETTQELCIHARPDRLELGQPQCDGKHSESIRQARTE